MLKAIGWILLINPNNGILNNLWFSFGFEEPLFNAYTIPAMFWVDSSARIGGMNSSSS